MKLTAFRVTNYRSVLDSGWVEVADLGVLMGKNESGKTALLKALHKFKPFRPEPYDISRDWPKCKWRERSTEAQVVAARFVLDEADSKELSELGGWNPAIGGVVVNRFYDGRYSVEFGEGKFGPFPDWEALAAAVNAKVKERNLQGVTGLAEECATAARKLAEGDAAGFTAAMATAREKVAAGGLPEPVGTQTLAALDEVTAYVTAETQRPLAKDRAGNVVTERIPNFIYMSDYRAFTGAARLDQLNERRSGGSTEDDKTLLMMMDMAGIRLDEEVARCGSDDQSDKDAQNQDMSAASVSLTKMMEGRWSQGAYEVDFRVNGFAFNTYVRDKSDPGLIWLEDRSKGFQWFFAFDLMFMYETQGTFKGAVILLDEPGLHLHVEAQRDLLKRMGKYAEGNQLIYTSHLPFMLDPDRYSDVRFVVRDADRGTWVTDDPSQVDPQSKFPFQAAVGLSMGNSFLFQQHNLVVEGVTDFWYLDAMSHACADVGLQGLEPGITITPSGGATEAAYVASILKGQNLAVVVLLDSDQAGDTAYDRLVKRWLMQDRHVMRVGSVAPSSPAETEDLFDAAFYIEAINQAYAKELGKKPLSEGEVGRHKHPCIVDRVNDALLARGMKPNAEGLAYNKGRTAKHLVRAVGNSSVSVPQTTLDRFASLFGAINSAMAHVAAEQKGS